MDLQFLVSNQTNPYWNIAVENYLMSCPDAATVVLYLWRNRRTVVIGQNQNPFAECNVELLESEGGYLMRRRTGGGAVYHDEGNLNFSFVVSKELYDLPRQFSVLQQAVADFGLITELSGRNDVLCEGRKFSGNAFSKGSLRNLHHGTILIRSNMDDLARYLRPKPAKLRKHGVGSVLSRVVNLADLNADITSESLVPHLQAAFEQVYGGKASVLDFDELVSRHEVESRYREFASDAWRYGNWRTFSAQRSGQFDWGSVEVALSVEDDVIREVRIASDGLDLDSIDEARRKLTGASSLVAPQPRDQVQRDIFSLIY